MNDYEIKDEIVQYARRYLGVAYLWGGDDPLAGFDCSGLVMECLKAVGVCGHNQDLSAHQIYKLVKNFEDPTGPSHGALAFYGDNVDIIHVGICINDDIMIEAAGGGDDIISRERAILKNAFVRIRPIRYRKDYLCIVKPNYERIIKDRGL